jgi:putative spermidine/putrescine transport system ATP-binding protein
VSSHPSVLSGSAIVVRPEDISIAADLKSVPAGANAVPARIRDLEYMGSYRTAMLTFGEKGLTGRARIDALDATHAIGDDVVAWWRPQRQRIVAA